MKTTGRTTLLLSLFVLVTNLLNAQCISQRDLKELRKKEDSLKILSDKMINAQDAPERFRSDSNFIRGLVRALKTSNSFYYPFDSLRTISHLYSPDSTFRIFTWQLKKDEYVSLQNHQIPEEYNIFFHCSL